MVPVTLSSRYRVCHAILRFCKDNFIPTLKSIQKGRTCIIIALLNQKSPERLHNKEEDKEEEEEEEFIWNAKRAGRFLTKAYREYFIGESARET